MILLDTCILIDILREKPEALALADRYSEPVAISVISIQELYAGIRPKEVATVEHMIDRANKIPVTAEMAKQAGDFVRQYRKSHGLDSNDSLIAATAAHTGAELITCNLKHFPMFSALTRPY